MNIKFYYFNLTKLDTTVPTAVTITYNSGSNTCTWKNDYDLTLSASALSGISFYEIDLNNDGISDSVVSGHFIPANGANTHTMRFRAVSVSGLRGEWTAEQHIHMDTEAPVPYYWVWGEITQDVARFYVQVAENIGLPTTSGTYDGHKVGVYCPTSTESGGYTNWYYFPATYDKSASAYRCDITPSVFGHYNQNYLIGIHVYDNANNSYTGPKDGITVYIP